jgi:hypothetical protein
VGSRERRSGKRTVALIVLCFVLVLGFFGTLSYVNAALNFMTPLYSDGGVRSVVLRSGDRGESADRIDLTLKDKQQGDFVANLRDVQYSRIGAAVGGRPVECSINTAGQDIKILISMRMAEGNKPVADIGYEAFGFMPVTYLSKNLGEWLYDNIPQMARLAHSNQARAVPPSPASAEGPASAVTH